MNNILGLVHQFQLSYSFNLTTVCFAVTCMESHRSVVHLEDYIKPTTLLKERTDHNTGNSMPYSFQLYVRCPTEFMNIEGL